MGCIEELNAEVVAGGVEAAGTADVDRNLVGLEVEEQTSFAITYSDDSAVWFFFFEDCDAVRRRRVVYEKRKREMVIRCFCSLLVRLG